MSLSGMEPCHLLDPTPAAEPQMYANPKKVSFFTRVEFVMGARIQHEKLDSLRFLHDSYPNSWILHDSNTIVHDLNTKLTFVIFFLNSPHKLAWISGLHEHIHEFTRFLYDSTTNPTRTVSFNTISTILAPKKKNSHSCIDRALVERGCNMPYIVIYFVVTVMKALTIKVE